MGKNPHFVINVRTGDRKYAGTDANVHIVLHDDAGNRSDEIRLDNFLHDDFERGQEDRFEVGDRQVSSLEKHGRVDQVEFWRDDAGLGSGWFVEKITVENRRTNRLYVFPVFRWIRPFDHYFIRHLDTSLPQDDPHAQQREKELEEKRGTYTYTQKAPGLPAQIHTLPSDEQFSSDYKWDIMKKKIQLVARSKLNHLLSGSWTTLVDIMNVYGNTFPRPRGADRWRNDLYFGLQRTSCQNPYLIELCKAIPEKFPVTHAMLEPLLEGLTIQQALDGRRLFLCDLHVLQDLSVKPGFVCCVPMSLFFLDKDDQLKPVAIQLFQTPGPDNPIFLPTDDETLWTLVKMWYNNADAVHHQSLAHLGFTHLLMEGVVICTNRQLSPSHPVFKLLAPHFLYLLAINTRGVETLISENGWVDKTVTVGKSGMFELISRGINIWRLDVHGTLPEDLKRRGLDDPKVLPCYHFRDDALLFYHAIRKYVTSYVDLYYDTPEKLAGDTEIQRWAAELVMPRDNDKGGCGLLGVPGNGSLTCTDQLVTILTSIIYTCSVSHAAANFPQYDEYGFPPNYPAMLRGQPPTNKEPRTDKDILNALPDRLTTIDMLTITTILSRKGTNSLGDFEVQYIFDPRAMAVVEEFRRDLKKIGEEIKERNTRRLVPYTDLDPAVVPNSISI
ncbi:allene oxide synthase-lipoxygenase protein-like [Babylonia areolata]|uniref:allene oxide synthase-lipoxygenase protein-like n=1 Tax=Babylonia areolata TaxID=304850 RepID=UPI003FCF3E2C